MLDLYFSGTPPDRIAIELKRNPKAIKRRIEQFVSNERGRAVLYVPFKRMVRTSLRLTQNETLLIAAHVRNGVPSKATAHVLQRVVSEVNPDWKRKAEVKTAKTFASSLDLFLACRYAKLKWQEDLVNPDTYAAMEEEEVEYGGAKSTLAHHQKPETMPERIQYLALYLSRRIRDQARDDRLRQLFPKL